MTMREMGSSIAATRLINGFWAGLSLGVYLAGKVAEADGDNLKGIFGTAIFTAFVVYLILNMIMKFSKIAMLIVILYAGLSSGYLITKFLSLWPFGEALRDQSDKWFWIVAGVICVVHWLYNVGSLYTYDRDRAAEKYTNAKAIFEIFHPNEVYKSPEEKEHEAEMERTREQWRMNRERAQMEKEEKMRRMMAESTADKWFAGCNDLDSLNKRHKKLMAMYHPDSEDGDEEISREINQAYEELRSRFE